MSKSKPKGPWGEIIYIDPDDEESVDEIHKLIKELKDLRKAPINWDNVSMMKAEALRQAEIGKLDKKIYDLIKLKKQKAMFK